MNKYKKVVTERIKEIKNTANMNAKKMMFSLMDQSKLTPYVECYDDKLFMFEDRKYTHGVCFHLYGESVNINLFPYFYYCLNFCFIFLILFKNLILFREDKNVIIKKNFVICAVNFM
jgi:hypothetical protein